MKAIAERLPQDPDSSFLLRETDVSFCGTRVADNFPVYELILVLEGKGKRCSIDHVSDFGPGDLVFIAPGLPLVYRSAEGYHQNESGSGCRAISIRFRENFLGGFFFDIPEMSLIKSLFHSAKRGIRFHGSTRATVQSRLQEVARSHEGFDKLSALLGILHLLSKSEEKEFLSARPIIGHRLSDNDRLVKVYDYVVANFNRNICINEVAALLTMAPTAFSRYFRKKTGKTFNLFLKEMRVEHAYMLLIADNFKVAQIGKICGFGNLSNFNRQFKNITELTPLSYKMRFRPNFE